MVGITWHGLGGRDRSLNYCSGNILLELLALAFIPGPLLFYQYSEHLHTKSVTPRAV